jgi:hypothetical protein
MPFPVSIWVSNVCREIIINNKREAQQRETTEDIV